MKKYIFLIIICVVFLSCNNPTDNVGNEIPILQNAIIGTSSSAIISGQETTSFKLGQYVYFGFTVIDDDLDVEKIVLTQKSDGYMIGPDFIELPKQESKNQFYIGNIQAEYDGNWIVEAYCIDKKGNKSNTIQKNISVTTDGVAFYTIKYDINGGIGEAPIDNRKYTSSMNTILKEASGFYKPNYTFLYWHNEPNGSKTFGLLPGEGVGISGTGEKTFYAVWNNPIENININKSSSSGNINNYLITWEEPNQLEFSHILINIFMTTTYSPKTIYISDITIEKEIKQYNFIYKKEIWDYNPSFDIEFTLIDKQGFPTGKIVYILNYESNNWFLLE